MGLQTEPVEYVLMSLLHRSSLMLNFWVKKPNHLAITEGFKTEDVVEMVVWEDETYSQTLEVFRLADFSSASVVKTESFSMADRYHEPGAVAARKRGYWVEDAKKSYTEPGEA